MRLTMLGHSCVRLEKAGAALVIDPGGWSQPGALDGAAAVLVTHEHPDHLDAAAVRSALAASDGLELWANGSVAGQFAEFGARVHEVADGDAFTAAGFEVRVHGRDHAVIHPDLPVVPNTGFLVDGEVFHPGDSLTMPGARVGTLLLPVSAPWLKFAEAADFARAIGPERGYAIHDAILNANGLSLIANLLGLAAGSGGGQFARLEPGTSVDLSR
jgi:L-ascorbate metabolism protein UlaG (beta-lactamase superfamily)